MGILYMVGVPIGNPQDITLRALAALRTADVIFCEDTRVTARLLKHYEDMPQKVLVSCRAHNEEQSVRRALSLLKEGKNICYVSDAGTPGISDPGAKLIRGIRGSEFKVVPIPGVSAFTTIISASPYADSVITFEGFLPQKGEKRLKRLRELYARDEAFVVYESPYRIRKLFEELEQLDAQARILVGREMTKDYEEYQAGSLREIKALYSEGSKRILGEFCVLVSRAAVKRQYPS